MTQQNGISFDLTVPPSYPYLDSARDGWRRPSALRLTAALSISEAKPASARASTSP